QNQSFHPNFTTQFCTPTLEEKWFAQLATRKQQLDEDVDTYYTAIQELLRRVDQGPNFPKWLRPEFVLSVAPSTSNTLQAAYEQARVYKSACKQNLSNPSIPLSALYTAQAISSAPIELSLPRLLQR
ncbi:20871_t:CDS:2, partial [Gigaspora rosea]